MNNQHQTSLPKPGKAALNLGQMSENLERIPFRGAMATGTSLGMRFGLDWARFHDFPHGELDAPETIPHGSHESMTTEIAGKPAWTFANGANFTRAFMRRF